MSHIHQHFMGGNRFVQAGQRFASVFGNQRAWACYFAMTGLVGFIIIVLLILMNLQLQSELAKRQVIIVGETTAKQLVPLWPNGVGSTSCDTLCIEGSLESWIQSFRFISGETDQNQVLQREAQERTASMIGSGTPAATVVSQYYEHYSPYVIAAHGERLDVEQVHVDEDHTFPGRFNASWIDVVSNARTHAVIGQHSFSATIDAHSDPNARVEDQIKYNPGGVVITDFHQFGNQ